LCARADALFDVAGMYVLDVSRGAAGRLVLTVETDSVSVGCPSCGVVAVGHGRHQLRDRVLTDPPPGLPQIRGDPRRPIRAAMRGEDLPDLHRQLPAPATPARSIAERQL
jgi:hypothetical protein